ncbi:MAG: hypothetical protein R3F46_03110 [bacterium]
MRGSVFLFAIASTILPLLLGGCGGGNGTVSTTAGSDKVDVQDTQLQLELQSELLAMLASSGVDAGRSASRPPLGEGNHVLSSVLQASPPDGAGDPGSLRLLFVPRLLGDYDGNGEVSVADVTPLAQNFGKNVFYSDPAVPGGPDNPPAGDPYGEGHANWLLSRCDGDGNGVITSSDLTPIALHFGERADGWQVEWRTDDFSGFIPVDDPAGLLDGYSLGWQDGRISNLAQEFLLPWPLSGHAEVRLRAWDAQSGGFGAASAVQVYDSATSACAAGLQLIANEQPAPFLARFTAAGSTIDADSYILDFGDGSTQVIASITEFPIEHLYENGRIYTARLTVNCGPESASATVQAIATPVPTSKQVYLYAFNNRGFAPQTVRFSFAWTSEPAVRYVLDFGDGSQQLVSETGLADLPLEHVYTESGNFNAVLWLEDVYGGLRSASVPVTLTQPAPGVNVNLGVELVDKSTDRGYLFDLSGTTGEEAVLSFRGVIPDTVIDPSIFDKFWISGEQFYLLSSLDSAFLTISSEGKTYSDSVLLPKAHSPLATKDITVRVQATDDYGNWLANLPGVQFSLPLNNGVLQGSTFIYDLGYLSSSEGKFTIKSQDYMLSKQVDSAESNPLYLIPDPDDYAALSADYVWPQEAFEIPLYYLVFGGNLNISLTPRP